MKSFKSIIIISMLFVTMFVGLISIDFDDSIIGKVGGSTIYVGGSGPGNYSSIQSAIINSTAGDTIRVYSGVYNEDIFIYKTLKLIGNGSANTFINGTKTGSVVTINASGCLIDGFNVSGSKILGYWDYAGIKINRNYTTVINSTTHDNLYGIKINDYYVGYTKYNRVINCTSYSNFYDGINVTFSNFTTITNNSCFDNLFGITFYKSSGNTVINNTCSFNIFGIYGYVDNSTFYYNTLEKNDFYGVYIHNAFIGGNLFFLNNMIDNNKGGNQGYETSFEKNRWNFTRVGNYWSDLTAPDKDNNGIVDHSYNLTGVGAGKDFYPLTTRVIINAPIITTDNELIANEGKYYLVNYSAFDMDTHQNNLSWIMKTNATWLKFSSNQSLYGTPTGTDTGKYWVNISVYDGKNSDYTNFTLEVIPNKPPELNTTDVYVAFVNITYSVNYSATDLETSEENLTWTMKTNASWLNFTTNQSLYGTPSISDLGRYWVNITVSDGTYSDYTNFTITVYKDSYPRINTTNVVTGYADKNYSVNYSATDSDTPKENLTWSMKTNASFLNFSSSQELYGTPKTADIGSYWVNITVSDGNNSDWTNFTLQIKKITIPKPPKINTTNVPTAYVNKTYFVNYNADDPDTSYENLTWTMNTNGTLWLFFNSSQELYGKPSSTDIGSYWVNITVSDGNYSDWTNFTLTVKNTYPPKITTSNELKAYVNIEYNVSYTASDFDTTQNQLVWSMKTNAPWLSFSIDLLLSGTPSSTNTGLFWVNITVSDGIYSDYNNFTLTVPHPPEITTIKVSTAYVNKPYAVQYSATDKDTLQNNLIWNMKTNASWLSFSSSQLLSGTPGASDLNIFWVHINVTDGDYVVYTEFWLQVLKGDAPKILTNDLGTAFVNKKYSVNYSATDSDNLQNELKWSMKTNASWLNFDSSQVLSGTPTISDTGSFWVYISVSDGYNIDSTNFTITVNKGDAPKILTTNVLDAFVGKYYSVNYSASDADSPIDKLNWNMKTNALWLRFSSNQELYGTPGISDAGSSWVYISVSDGVNLASTNFTITVNKGLAPIISTSNVITASVGKYYSVSYTATDADTPQNKLTWSMETNASWLSFSSSQELFGTPGVSDAGSLWVYISVTDGVNTASTNFTITVKRGQAPNILTTNVLTAKVNNHYSVNYTAIDGDTPDHELTWSFNTNASWLKFSSSQELYGTPVASDVGSFWVYISVSDGDYTDSTNFTITVMPIIKPIPPKLNTNNVLTAEVGKYYSVYYSATDFDTPYNKLTWSMETNASWLEFSSGQQLFGTPTSFDVGTYWIYITVNDGENYDWTNFTLTVKSVPGPKDNIPPVMVFSIPVTNSENIPLNITKIVIQFSEPMNTTSVESSISISPLFDHTIMWGRNDSQIMIVLKNNLEYNTPYKIIIGTGAEDRSGNNMESPINLDFVTQPDNDIPDSESTHGDDKHGLNNLTVLGLMTIVSIIIILVFFAVIFKKRKMKKEEQIKVVHTGFDQQNFVSKDVIDEVGIEQGIKNGSEELINELMTEALTSEKPSDFQLSEDEMLNKIKVKYSKKEISEDTYLMIEEKLNK